MSVNTSPCGAELRRGAFQPNDRVQLTDTKGRMQTITLRTGGTYHTHRGSLEHDEIIGKPEGIIVKTTSGVELQALRPLLSDYTISMPRGAAVVYPKDAGQIVAMADIFPGARVIEAGVGSGALSLFLLRAIGDQGELHSFERREDFAEIANKNVEHFFGGPHPAWQLTVCDLADGIEEFITPASIDRVVLDMLAPWENIDAAAKALTPGGVLICYVATATQLSRVCEALRSDGRYTEPQAFETLVRGWHLEGLAVRPQHRMMGHTGFLITARRIADGYSPILRKRRPAKGAYETEEWNEEAFGQAVVSERKTKKVLKRFGGLRATNTGEVAVQATVKAPDLD